MVPSPRGELDSRVSVLPCSVLHLGDPIDLPKHPNSNAVFVVHTAVILGATLRGKYLRVPG